MFPSNMIAYSIESDQDISSIDKHLVTFLNKNGEKISEIELSDGEALSNGEIPNQKEASSLTKEEAEAIGKAFDVNSELSEDLVLKQVFGEEETIVSSSEEETSAESVEESQMTSSETEESVPQKRASSKETDKENKKEGKKSEKAKKEMAPLAAVTGDKIELSDGDTLTFTGANSFTATGVSGTQTSNSDSYVEVSAGAAATIKVEAGVTATIKYVYGPDSTVNFTGDGTLVLDNGFTSGTGTNLDFNSMQTSHSDPLFETVAGAVIRKAVFDKATVDIKGDMLGALFEDMTAKNNSVLTVQSKADPIDVNAENSVDFEKGKGLYVQKLASIESGTALTTEGYHAGFYNLGSIEVNDADLTGTSRTGGSAGGIATHGRLIASNGANVQGMTSVSGVSPEEFAAGIFTGVSLEATGSTTKVVGECTTSSAKGSSGIWVRADIDNGNGYLKVNAATVEGLGGAYGIALGEMETTYSDHASYGIIENGAHVIGSNSKGQGNIVGFYHGRSKAYDETENYLKVTNSTLDAYTKGTIENGRLSSIAAMKVHNLIADNATITATNDSDYNDSIHILNNYTVKNSTVKSSVGGNAGEDNLSFGPNTRASLYVADGELLQTGGTFDGVGNIRVYRKNLTLEKAGTMDVKSDKIGVRLMTKDLIVNDANSKIEVIGNKETDAQIGASVAGKVSVSEGSLIVEKAKDVGLVATGDILATSDGTISGACTDDTSAATDIGGVVSKSGDITADNGNIIGLTVHEYNDSDKVSGATDHAAVHAKASGKKVSSINDGTVDEYYEKQCQTLYKVWQKKYADKGVSISTADFAKYTWTSRGNGSNSWSNSAQDDRIVTKADGSAIKAVAIAASEFIVANSKAGAISSTHFEKDSNSKHNVHFKLALADSEDTALHKKVAKGKTTNKADFSEDIFEKGISKDDQFTYFIEMTTPATGVDGYDSIDITDTLPSKTALDDTLTNSITMNVGTKALTISGDELRDGSAKVGEIEYNSTTRKLEAHLNQAGINLLTTPNSTIELFVTVKATENITKGATLKNKADVSINGDDPTDSNESKITVLEEPKELKKQVKAADGTYKDTKTINAGTEQTLDYQVTMRLPDSLAGYDQLVLTDIAPAGTTFTGTPTCKVEGSEVGTVVMKDDSSLLRVDLSKTQLTGLESKDIKINVQLTVPANYSANTIKNIASYWINPSTPGNSTSSGTTEPGDAADGTAENIVTVNTTFSVTYDGNSHSAGTVPVDSKLYTVGETVGLKKPGTMARSGFKFIGWNDKADGKGTNYSFDSTSEVFTPSSFQMPAKNVTLFAQWEASQDITILKKDASSKQIMDGVEFTLTKPAEASFKQVKTSNNSGKLTFSDLETGEYELRETKTKSGYQLPYGYWKVKVEIVSNQVKVTFTGEAEKNGAKPPAVEWSSTEDAYIIYNSKTYTLPKTGKALTALKVVLAGAGVLTIALSIYGVNRKRRGV
ncbi:isopeptide-forming domain-containing fimbrial protein [Enterococcus raffinosus]|uniref:SpaA isopeptide-forming pilin-related protein n=1 Tax=Enterococcus raffinosus TaxID=71452 RepID=UPI001C46BB79|nr:isopeptide-forming domain-containing fimbrial protein [Enterococcus raffinosus]QXJ60127.1 isopeptide-forming domain-containing fimbrial protein [Enterococcus raffinosus]